MVTENGADHAADRDLVLVCLLRRKLLAGGAQSIALAKLLERWVRDNPRLYVGQHWPR